MKSVDLARNSCRSTVCRSSSKSTLMIALVINRSSPQADARKVCGARQWLSHGMHNMHATWTKARFVLFSGGAAQLNRYALVFLLVLSACGAPLHRATLTPK